MDEERVLATLGNVLAEERNARGYTQERLSLDANIDRSYMSDIERGASALTFIKLWQICSTLGVPPSVLIARTEQRLGAFQAGTPTV